MATANMATSADMRTMMIQKSANASLLASVSMESNAVSNTLFLRSQFVYSTWRAIATTGPSAALIIQLSVSYLKRANVQLVISAPSTTTHLSKKSRLR